MARLPPDVAKETELSGPLDETLLGVLNVIDRDAQTSQRTISRELGVALGLANSYLKRCVRKGWIKVRQVPPRRYLYYLTPQGLAEKTRLTGQYFAASFKFFRRAREQISELMDYCETRHWRRLVLAGVSELAEVGILCANDKTIELLGIVDSEHAGTRFGGLPVKAALADFDDVDAVVVTSLTAAGVVFQELQSEIEAERILVPRLLRIALPNDGMARERMQVAK